MLSKVSHLVLLQGVVKSRLIRVLNKMNTSFEFGPLCSIYRILISYLPDITTPLFRKSS